MRHLETRIEGEVGTITIDHAAKRNALSRQLVDAIVEALDRLSQERVRAIVLRAKPGVKVWSSGHDVEELPEGGRDPLGWDDPLRYLVRAIEGTGHANFLADYLTAERKRQAIADLEAAVRDPNSIEQRFQAIIEKHPWLFGGQYVATRPERMIVLGDQFDVPLVTADGSIHVVELKRANIPNLVKTYRKHLMVGQPVHEAVSQSANYLRSADENVPGIQYNFGIDARRISATVVIGHIDYNTEEMTEQAFYQTLRTYNSHLSRIEVITYDQLISSALNALKMAGSSDVGSDESVVETQPQPVVADDPWGSAPSSTFSSVASTDDPWGTPPPSSFNASNDDPFGSSNNPDDEPPF